MHLTACSEKPVGSPWQSCPTVEAKDKLLALGTCKTVPRPAHLSICKHAHCWVL